MTCDPFSRESVGHAYVQAGHAARECVELCRRALLRGIAEEDEVADSPGGDSGHSHNLLDEHAPAGVHRWPERRRRDIKRPSCRKEPSHTTSSSIVTAPSESKC